MKGVANHSQVSNKTTDYEHTKADKCESLLMIHTTHQMVDSLTSQNMENKPQKKIKYPRAIKLSASANFSQS